MPSYTQDNRPLSVTTPLGKDVLLLERLSGEEAVSLYRSTPDLKAVILDLTMPEMDGEECFRQLQLLDPKVRVIMSSGFSEQDVVQKFDGHALAGFIQKPYTLKALREVMRKAFPPQAL